MGTVGATFILIGIGLLYMMTGTLNMADLAERLPAVMHTRSVQAAFGLLTVGLAIKMALFPLHQWLPEAYSRAPSAVSALFAASSTKVAVYVLVRLFYGVFGVEYSFDVMQIGRLLLPVAMLGIVVASLVAIYQDDIKRLFAWSRPPSSSRSAASRSASARSASAPWPAWDVACRGPWARW